MRNAGEQDVTAQVCIDQLGFGNARPTTQAGFLRAHGIDDLVEEGRRYWDAHRERPDLRAMSMRSRVREAEALCDPRGLGAFTVLEIDVP